jgi:hypothetical protein
MQNVFPVESLLLFRNLSKQIVDKMILGITTPKEKSILYRTGIEDGIAQGVACRSNRTARR